jgi:thymidylate synthase (FAD)
MPRITVTSAEEILGLYFPVLDHGFVSLVDYMGGDVAIERAARVSYGAGTRKATETRGLIRYLKRHAHTSPFEMAEVTLHCCMPIFVARQWVRHRTANLNEQSARYSVVPMMFYTPEREHVQLQSTDNKQGRAGEPVSEEVYDILLNEWSDNRNQASQVYDYSLHEVGLARELARIDLPLSTYTQWYWKVDLHNLMHFLRLRCDPHAQYEIRAFAAVMAGILQKVAPLTYEAWVDYDLLAQQFSRLEVAMLATGATTNKATEKEVAAQYGISPREVREFFGKLHERKPPDFTLDLGTARPGSYYEEMFAEAAPGKSA